MVAISFYSVIAGFMVLIVSLFSSKGEDYKNSFIVLGASYIGLMTGPQFLSFIAKYTPVTFDWGLLQVDQALGVDVPSIMYWTMSHGLLWSTANLIYISPPLIVALAWATEKNPEFMWMMGLSFVGCFISYVLVPAVGPRYLGLSIVGVPRNCVPSMHICWALICTMQSRKPLIKSLLGVYAVVSSVVVLLIGAHYVTDVLLVIPFAYCVRSLGMRMVVSPRIVPSESASCVVSQV
jgi:hypothetical protein